MPLDMPENYGQATMQWQVVGRSNPLSCTLGVLDSAGDSTPDTIAQTIYDALTAVGGFCDADRMWDVFTFEGVSVHLKSGGVILGGNSTGTVAGTNSTASVQPMIVSSTLVVGKRTSLIGRKYRGRMYMPLMAFGENTIDYNGNIQSAVVGVAVTAAGLLYSRMVADGYPPMILHELPQSEPIASPTPITSFSVSNKVGTQRRRLR